MSLPVWIEYAETVAYWAAIVEDDPNPETYRARWQARIRHPSWTQKRNDFLWYTSNHCEHCKGVFRDEDLELHHLHYDTLWYETNRDLELLCGPCHRVADEDRREAAKASGSAASVHERALAYMETANQYSGQADWPVSYEQAVDAVLGWMTDQ